MKKEHTERYTRGSLPPGETDWDRVDALTDREIQRAAASDPDAAPPLDAAFFGGAEQVPPVDPSRVPVTLFVDQELLRFYQAMGPRHREMMHTALLRYALEMGDDTPMGADYEPVSPAEAAEVLRELFGADHPATIDEERRIQEALQQALEYWRDHLRGSITKAAR
ncbi:MAG TPA: hypothetical protein VHG28_09095 [Longimicrobiaceae bacterium]|nr:hypothetical protein [Longimicrobiaceae bacterium]